MLAQESLRGPWERERVVHGELLVLQNTALSKAAATATASSLCRADASSPCPLVRREPPVRREHHPLRGSPNPSQEVLEGSRWLGVFFGFGDRRRRCIMGAIVSIF